MKIFFKSLDKKAFTLIEFLLVIAIIGLLSAFVFIATIKFYNNAYKSKTREEMSNIAKAIELYLMDNNYNYPADVDRGLPNGIEKYLSTNPNWPNAPWPGSFYDWDNWAPGNLSYDPKEQIYQISVRFCPFGDPSGCRFPNETWAANFDYYSSVYWCLSGPCRAHSSMPNDHPSCCMGGSCPATAQKCQ